MGFHPANLAVRFILELVILISLGLWGWKQGDGWERFALAFALPITAGTIWATFAVPDDPSRSGKAPVAVSGMIRILIEIGLFASAAWALYNAGFPRFSFLFIFISIFHYAISYDRIKWLLNH